MRPLLREHVSVLDIDSQDVRFFCSHRSRMLHFRIDETGRRAIEAADGRRSVGDILAEIDARRVTAADAAAFFGGLIEAGVFRDAAKDARIAFDADYETRLERQFVYLAGLAPAGRTGRDLQERLRRSRVLVVGVGGAGSHLAVQLAGIGVGRMTVVDPDRVELGNIGRQIYYAGHIGELKVEAVRRVVGAIAPQTEVTPLMEKLVPGSAWLRERIRDFDLVLNCADHPSVDLTSRWLFEVCYPARVPLIPAGGYNGHMTSLPPTLIPGRSTCWPCFEAATTRKNSGYTGELNLSKIKSGIFLPATMAMASLQIPEVVRVLTGYEPPRFANRRGEFDLNSATLKIEEVPPTSGCPTCEGLI